MNAQPITTTSSSTQGNANTPARPQLTAVGSSSQQGSRPAAAAPSKPAPGKRAKSSSRTKKKSSRAKTAKKTTSAQSTPVRAAAASATRPAKRKTSSRSTARRSVKAVKTATGTAKKITDNVASAAAKNASSFTSPFTANPQAWNGNSGSWANATKEFWTMKGTNQAYNMDQFSQTTMKQMEDAIASSKQAIDASMKSCTILGKGAEDIVKTCISKTQAANEKGAAAIKTLMACKTINEFAEVQNKLAQEWFEDAMNTAAAMSEMCVKVAMDACEPLNAQVTKTMKKANAA